MNTCIHPSFSMDIVGRRIFLTTFLPFLFFNTSCTDSIETKDFPAIWHEPCMIVNYEQDNTIEGKYIRVETFTSSDSSITLALPSDFYIDESNHENWVIGWGDQIPLYDAGVENIRDIAGIDVQSGKIRLGTLRRGTGFPENDQRLAFWNQNPSGFVNHIGKPIIDPSKWPQFSGESVSFSSIEYDETLQKWIMIINECDTSAIQIYAAQSDDLIHWQPARDGNPILTPDDFRDAAWAGTDPTGTIHQTPFVSDIVRQDGKWYLFMDGYDDQGLRHIGVAVSEGTLLGPYEVHPQPVLSPGRTGSWNDRSVFYAKIKKHDQGFILFYDGRNADDYERIGMATSTNLTDWTQSDANPVLDQHSGWRSWKGTTEPNHIEVSEEGIILMAAGVKKFKMGPWHHYITRRMYMDKSGNVDDAQLGIFLSTDGGRSFIAHKSNPVFTNNYANPYENEHMGGNFKLIPTDSVDYLIYQAKSSFRGLKYNVMLRTRKKHTPSYPNPPSER